MEDFLMPSFYQGFGGFPFNKDSEGQLTLRSPLIGGAENVPWICMEEDFGDLVHGIFLNPLRWNRRTVQAVGDIQSWAEIVDTFVRGMQMTLMITWILCVPLITDVFNLVHKQPARFIGYSDPSTFPAFGKPELKESKDVFEFYQLRDGEIFGCGITESQTAAELKKAAYQAKKGTKGRETLMTCEEWFADVFPRHK